jgi:hypothetical protein
MQRKYLALVGMQRYDMMLYDNEIDSRHALLRPTHSADETGCTDMILVDRGNAFRYIQLMVLHIFLTDQHARVRTPIPVTPPINDRPSLQSLISSPSSSLTVSSD